MAARRPTSPRVSDYTIALLDKLEGNTGVPRKARAELNLGGTEVAVLILPPNTDHEDKPGEAVYIALDGEGEIQIEEEPHRLFRDKAIRVGKQVSRKLRADKHGLRVLAIRGPNA
jgi:mannose-6-phosphate isomerase-like protein (cupin superfamily)